MSKIINKAFLKNIFTEYDDSLTKKLNIDPLGFQVVWTLFGQKIFKNKTTSVALDIRSYNINLFNHYVVYKLLHEDQWEELITNNRRGKIEKILVTLENMLTWSWFRNSDNGKWSNDQKKGLLGTSRAQVKWKDKDQLSINLNEDIDKIELLKNQKSLGVNGRYKGPFMSIGFFDSNYSDAGYKNTQAIGLFGETAKLIKDDNSPFRELYEGVYQFLKEYRTNVPMPDSLTDLYMKTFKDSTVTAKYTREFWMKNLGLDNSEAKAIYNNIDSDKTSVSSIFKKANNEYSSGLFDDILLLEPQLTYIDILFDYLLTEAGKALTEIDNQYFTLLGKFEWSGLADNATGYARERIELLSKIDNATELINYHKKIMDKRNQSPWIEIDKENKLKVSININADIDKLKSKLDKGLDNEWIHDYYIGSIRNIKRGLES